MQVVATFDPSAKTTDTININAPSGTYKMVIMNESNVNLIFTFAGGDTTQVPAWQSRLYCRSDSHSKVTWTQQSILTASNSPISQVIVELYANDEKIIEGYPAPLVRQTNVGNTVTTLPTSVPEIINTGQPPGQVIVFSEPIGDPSTLGAVHLSNNGIFLLGDQTYTGEMTFSTPGLAQMLLAANTFLQMIDATGAIDIDIRPGSATVNGGTSGNATVYQPFRGTFKLAIVQLNSIKSGVGTNPTLALPVGFTFGYHGITSGCGPVQYLLGGLVQTLQQLTSFSAGANNGVTAETTSQNNWIFHSDTGVDTLKFTGNGVAQGGLIILIGI